MTAAPLARRTSQYVIAFGPITGWTMSDTLDELLTAAHAAGLLVAGSHLKNLSGQASVVLRFPDDAAAVTAAHALSADVQAPLVGVVTGLGVHRREVTV